MSLSKKMREQSQQLSIFCSFLFSLILFPWTSFGLNNLDSQIWPLVCSVSILATLQRLPKPNPYLILALVFAYFGFLWSLLFSSGHIFLIARSFYNFSSFFVVLYLSMILTMRFQSSLRSVFIITNIVWVIGALIEIVMPSLLSVLGNARTSPGRGLTSFAPEPTFFGLTLLFYILILDALTEIKQCSVVSYPLMIANLAAIILLAKASMIILFMVIGFGILIVVNLLSARIRLIFRLLLMLLIFFFVFYSLDLFSYLQKYRIGDLAQKVFSVGILQIIKLDASINERLQHVVYSLYGSYQNLFLPNGLDNFSNVWKAANPSMQEYFWHGKPDDKIMSWIGDWIYSLGLFGICSLCLLLGLLRGIGGRAIVRLSVLSMALVSAVPVANPFVPILLGIEIVNIYKKRARES